MATFRITSAVGRTCNTKSGSTLAGHARESLDTRKVVDGHVVEAHRLLDTVPRKSTRAT